MTVWPDKLGTYVRCGRSSPIKRVAAAVGEGSMAIAFVHQYLRDADAQLGTAAAGASAPASG